MLLFLVIGAGSSNTTGSILFIINLITTIVMIYFYKSSRKDDKLVHPITVCAQTERRAFSLALINFKKHHLKGTPNLIAI